jgi:hypothetical protein
MWPIVGSFVAVEERLEQERTRLALIRLQISKTEVEREIEKQLE